MTGCPCGLPLTVMSLPVSARVVCRVFACKDLLRALSRARVVLMRVASAQHLMLGCSVVGALLNARRVCVPVCLYVPLTHGVSCCAIDGL